MFGLGAPELLIVLVVVLVLFGGKKLPDLARSLGSAKREFHEGGLDAAREAADAEAAAPVNSTTPTAAENGAKTSDLTP